MTYASYNIDENGNISCTSGSTNDPDGKIARENAKKKAEENRAAKEKVEKKRAEKKAEQEHIEKRRVEKAEAKDKTDEYTISAVGTDVKSITSQLINSILSGTTNGTVGFDSCLVINEEEAEVVKIIFDKYIHTDMGAESIASYLNEHGYKKNKHFPRDLDYFGTSTIKRILVNPIYNGKMAYGRLTMEKVKGTRDQYRRVDCDDYIVADGVHDAIIDDEVWKSAKLKHAALGHKWEKRYSLEHEHILSGFIKCPVCGAGMTGSVSRRHNKETGEYKDDFLLSLS